MTHGASQATALDITKCLLRWRDGDSDALAQLTDLVYGELRRLAAVFLRGEASGHTLQPTALVHELYLRIEGVREVDWKCRAQFFAISARMMRNILVDHARIRRAAKRGSGNVLPLSDCDFRSRWQPRYPSGRYGPQPFRRQISPAGAGSRTPLLRRADVRGHRGGHAAPIRKHLAAHRRTRLAVRSRLVAQ